MKVCYWCAEILLKEEEHHSMAGFHCECAVRSIIGPVAHIEKRCSCYVAGSIEHDPPGMSKREAALAAYLANNRTHNIAQA